LYYEKAYCLDFSISTGLGAFLLGILRDLRLLGLGLQTSDCNHGDMWHGSWLAYGRNNPLHKKKKDKLRVLKFSAKLSAAIAAFFII